MSSARRGIATDEMITVAKEEEITLGNNVPCTMCGSACVYIMLLQQRKYESNAENNKNN
jgi:hypothetical protein